MGQLRPIQKDVSPTEEQRQSTMEHATMLASITYDIGGSACRVLAHGVCIDGIEKGDWAITVERIG